MLRKYPSAKKVLLSAIAVLAVIWAAAYSRHSYAETYAVSWDPSALAFEGMPGETQTASVTVHAGRLFAKTLCIGSSEKTVIRVSDDLAPFVTVSPDAVCGQNTDVSLTVSVPLDAGEAMINGELRLFREIKLFGKARSFPMKLAKNLPLTLSIVTEDDGLPPDPGEAGKATIAGIDSDGDGVRDDIQRYIAFTYPDSEKVRLALEQSAKEIQVALLSADDEEESIRLWHERKAGDCLDYVMGGINEGADAGLDLLSQFLNTKERSEAYFQFGQNISGDVSGTVHPWEYKTQCDFNPDEAEN